MKKVKDIAIFGAGGFGREVACLLRKINAVEPTWNFVGFYDDGLEKGSRVDYGEILGGIADLNVVERPLSVVVALGNPKTLQTVVGKSPTIILISQISFRPMWRCSIPTISEWEKAMWCRWAISSRAM